MQDELMRKLDLQLMMTKVIAALIGLILAVVVIGLCILVPPALKALSTAQEVMNTANATMNEANAAILAAEQSMENVESMTDSIIETSNQLNAFVNENAESMATAVEQIGSIDFQGLNGAIKDLQDAVGPFANMMRKFQ